MDPLGLQAFVEYSINEGRTDSEGASVQPMGEEFANETEQLVNELDNSLQCGINSFSADTKVATKDGEKDISKIQIGDYVLAWNAQTNTISFYRVTDTIHHTDKTIVKLTIGNETLTTTPEHPFYVDGKGWVYAKDLKVGDSIRKADGSTGKVKSLKIEQSTQEMYNLTVDQAHTFFVGEGQWLVHNICPTGDEFASEAPTSWRDAERILGKDLGLPKNTEVFRATDYGLERNRIPDFVGNDFIADAKWYRESQVSLVSQLRDFVQIAQQTDRPLFIYVRQATEVTENALEAIQSTGGDVIWYFP